MKVILNVFVSIRGGSRHSPYSHRRMSDFLAENRPFHIYSIANSSLHIIYNFPYLMLTKHTHIYLIDSINNGLLFSNKCHIDIPFVVNYREPITSRAKFE